MFAQQTHHVAPMAQLITANFVRLITEKEGWNLSILLFLILSGILSFPQWFFLRKRKHRERAS